MRKRRFPSASDPRSEEELAITPDSPRHLIDVQIFASPLVRIGRWRCPADHPQFVDSGPASDALFVFPREGVWIRRAGGEPFVADANTVTYYNPGQCYTRQRLSPRGDRCDWFAVAPAAIAETLSTHEPAAIDRPNTPFRFTHGPSDPDSYLRQRIVFQHVSRETKPDRLFVEEAVLSILGNVTSLAYDGHVLKPRRRRRPHDTDIVEATRGVIARRFKENLSLSELAREVGSSVFHLARAFKARAGLSLHAYRNQLRLRAALEPLAEPTINLIDIALDLGFSSHSHFSDAFRRKFHATPSAVRRCLSQCSRQCGRAIR